MALRHRAIRATRSTAAPAAGSTLRHAVPPGGRDLRRTHRPAFANPGSQSTVGRVGGRSASHRLGSRDGDTLTFSATGLPAGLSINADHGLITGAPTTPGDYAVASVSPTARSDASVQLHLDGHRPPPFTLDPMPPATPKLVGTPVTYTATRTTAQRASTSGTSTTARRRRRTRPRRRSPIPSRTPASTT